MRDNAETAPDILQTRRRAGRFQNDLNLDLGLSKKQTASAGGTGASVSSAVSSGGGVSTIIGGGSGTGSTGGGGSYGGGGYCFVGDTPVLMADGRSRPISSVEVLKDFVMVPQPDNSLAPGRVAFKSISIAEAYVMVTFEDGRITSCKPEHRYRNIRDGYEPILGLDMALHLVDGLWTPMTVKKVERVKLAQPIRFYNIGVEDPQHAYVANGDWVANAKPRPDERDGYGYEIIY